MIFMLNWYLQRSRRERVGGRGITRSANEGLQLQLASLHATSV